LVRRGKKEEEKKEVGSTSLELFWETGGEMGRKVSQDIGIKTRNKKEAKEVRVKRKWGVEQVVGGGACAWSIPASHGKA